MLTYKCSSTSLVSQVCDFVRTDAYLLGYTGLARCRRRRPDIASHVMITLWNDRVTRCPSPCIGLQWRQRSPQTYFSDTQTLAWTRGICANTAASPYTTRLCSWRSWAYDNLAPRCLASCGYPYLWPHKQITRTHYIQSLTEYINAAIFLYKPWRLNAFFQFEIIINVLVSSFRFI